MLHRSCAVVVKPRTAMKSTVEFVAWVPQPLGKTGAVIPLFVPVIQRDLPHRNQAHPAGQTSRFAAPKLKHNFAVRPLKKRAIFRPQPYAYICVRCRQSFIVNERRGAIVATDRKGLPLPEPENSRRVRTFAEGPCHGQSGLRNDGRQTTIVTSPDGLVVRIAKAVAFLLGLQKDPPKTPDGRPILPTEAISANELLS